jgi:hypothetical protein
VAGDADGAEVVAGGSAKDADVTRIVVMIATNVFIRFSRGFAAIGHPMRPGAHDAAAKRWSPPLRIACTMDYSSIGWQRLSLQ